MPTEFTDDEIKEILDSNKIQYAKAERMKSREDGRSLQMFKLELKDRVEAEALISENLKCPQTMIIFKVGDLTVPISVRQSVITAKILDNRPKIVGPKLNVSSVIKTTYIKDAQIKKKSNESVLIVELVASYKGCPAYKNQAFRQHVMDNQKSYASILKQNSASPPQPKGDKLSFSADQLIKIVATMAIQFPQSQVHYTNAPKDAIGKRSSLCRRVSEAAKSQLSISISGSTLFDAIGSVRAPGLPASKIPVSIPGPLRFSASTKPSAILK